MCFDYRRNSTITAGCTLRFDAGGLSDQGRIRQNNEDAYKIEPSLDLFVLCDGMGGMAHGELASALA